MKERLALPSSGNGSERTLTVMPTATVSASVLVANVYSCAVPGIQPESNVVPVVRWTR